MDRSHQRKERRKEGRKGKGQRRKRINLIKIRKERRKKGKEREGNNRTKKQNEGR